MTKAVAAPMVVLRPAAVTRPKARPTLPSTGRGWHSESMPRVMSCEREMKDVTVCEASG